MKGDAAKIENLVDLLNKLIDPPEPDPISFIPQTAGWWLLAAILAVLLITVGWIIWKKRKRSAYRRAALAELDIVGNDPAAIAGILRRVSLVAYPRRKVAGLIGAEWLAFLCENGDFPDDGLKLIKTPYNGDIANIDRLREATRVWIKTHRGTP